MNRLTLLAFSCYLASCSPLAAKVNEGTLTGSLNFNISASIANVSDEDSFEETVTLYGETASSEVDAEAVIALSYSGQFIRQTSELTDLDFVTITGSQYTNVEFSGSAFYMGTTGLSALFSS